MSTIVAPHEPEPAKLAKVIDQMTRLGSPKIRAWWDGEKWIALEGSHRLAAAKALGRWTKRCVMILKTCRAIVLRTLLSTSRAQNSVRTTTSSTWDDGDDRISMPRPFHESQLDSNLIQ